MKLRKLVIGKGKGWERTEWRNEKGNRHREDGPAVLWVEGCAEEWFINGERHREDGPAIVSGDYKEWYVNGKKCYSEEEYHQEIYKRNLLKLNEGN